MAEQTPEQVDPASHRTYKVGTLLTGRCEHSGSIPEDAGCGSRGTTRGAFVTVKTSGWSGAIVPPECEPIKLELVGEYTGSQTESSSDWVGDQCHENIGLIFFTRSNEKTLTTPFTFEVVPADDSCPAANQSWRNRIRGEADRYKRALEENLRGRESIRTLLNETRDPNDIVRRAAEAQWRNIEIGLQGIRDDCVRISYALNESKEACEDFVNCDKGMATTMAEGPGSFCLAVHEIFTSFRAGANSGSQAYGWFKRDMPCLARLYEEGDFIDLVEYLAGARQPLAGFYTKFDGSPRDTTGN